jgi:hypothetical protein
VQAEAWYEKAAKQGDEKARNNLSLLQPKLEKAQLEVDIRAQGYQRVSITDFQLDAKSMPSKKRLAITGYYQMVGHQEALTEMPPQARLPNAYRLLLLTDDTPRETRRKLIELQKRACGEYSICEVTVLGHVEPCTETFMGQGVRNTTCLAVDDLR